MVHVTARLAEALLAERIKITSSLVLETVDELQELAVLLVLAKSGALAALETTSWC